MDRRAMGFNGVNGRDRAWTRDEAIDAGRLWVERLDEPPTRTVLDAALMRRQIRRSSALLAQLRERRALRAGRCPAWA